MSIATAERARTAPSTARALEHPSPNLALLAIIFTVLSLAGIGLVSGLAGIPRFPSPGEPSGALNSYFVSYRPWVLWDAFLQFGAAIPLGLFAASTVSRLRFLGIRAAGAEIALFGGFMAAFNALASGCVLWTLAQPDVAQTGTLAQPLDLLQFCLGGPGFAVGLGLLVAGVSVSAGVTKLVPGWLMWFGLVLAVIGELSWLSLMLPVADYLIPVTRAAAFVWLIAAGFLLPTSRSDAQSTSDRLQPA